MDIGAENQQAEKEKRNQGNRRAVCRCRGKGATANGYRRRKTASGERKDGIRKTEGLFAVVEGKARQRMNIGAENQQAGKEKTGIRKIEGLFAVVEGKARRADGYRRRKTVSGERKDGIRKTEGLFAVVDGKARRRMGIGAEKQQVEKEKTGSGKPAVCRCRWKDTTDGWTQAQRCNRRR